MVEMGKMLAIFGVVLIVVGGIVMLLGRTGLPLGRLPGDILYSREEYDVLFPPRDFDCPECRPVLGSVSHQPFQAVRRATSAKSMIYKYVTPKPLLFKDLAPAHSLSL